MRRFPLLPLADCPVDTYLACNGDVDAAPGSIAGRPQNIIGRAGCTRAMLFVAVVFLHRCFLHRCFFAPLFFA